MAQTLCSQKGKLRQTVTKRKCRLENSNRAEVLFSSLLVRQNWGLLAATYKKIGVEVDKHGQKYNIYIRREFV